MGLTTCAHEGTLGDQGDVLKLECGESRTCVNAQSCPTLCDPRPLRPWDFPGKNAGVGCHFLLCGIFLTQGSNPRLLPWQANSLPLSHLGSLVKAEQL